MTLSIARTPVRWTLTLDRAAKANALSGELVEALIEAVDAAEAQAVPVLAFQGAGRNFCAGFDFTGYEQLGEGELLLRFVRIETLLQRVARSSCLTVALAHGKCFGAGVDLVAACKWRIAAPQSTFRMPGLAFGLVLGTRRFAAIVGKERARDILEALQTFDADAALAMGFVRGVMPAEEWAGVLDQAGATAASLPPASRALLRDALDAGTDDADLAALVRSAAAPGIKDRIRKYLEPG